MKRKTKNPMRVSTKGQVTIPIEMRTKLGMLPNTEVSFIFQNGGILIQKQQNHTSTRGSKLIAKLSGKGNVKMSTDTILKLTRS